MLDSVLKRLPKPTDANLLVGFETSDDAGVYRLNEDLALVQTVDFLTPIVDDPYIYGQIAAANSLSDVYAMGGRPISALSVVGYPAGGSPDVLEQILRGGLSKMAEAHCTVAGGHSIRDEELKFGYAVTGLIHPTRIWRNVGARPGDVLLLTKPLGTGVIATALKQDRVAAGAAEAAAESMTRLNRDAAETLRELEGPAATGDGPVHAVTDVTGFGLLGHAHEMAHGSGVSFRIQHARVEYLPGAIDAARAGAVSGGLKNNREFLADCMEFSPGVPEEFRLLLLDPQTSGGLLIAIDPSRVGAAQTALDKRGIHARVVGDALPKRAPLIEIS